MNDKKIKKVPKTANKKVVKPVDSIKNYGRAIFVFSVLIFVLVLMFAGISLWQNGTVRNAMQFIKYNDSYQVVFLTSGQAYFGNITEITNEYILMENPFSIKIQQRQTGEVSEVSQSEIKLLSIEDEFYEPEGYMLIKKSVILFIEELKDSSQVVEIIKNYE